MLDGTPEIAAVVDLYRTSRLHLPEDREQGVEGVMGQDQSRVIGVVVIAGVIVAIWLGGVVSEKNQEIDRMR